MSFQQMFNFNCVNSSSSRASHILDTEHSLVCFIHCTDIISSMGFTLCIYLSALLNKVLKQTCHSQNLFNNASTNSVLNCEEFLKGKLSNHRIYFNFSHISTLI